MTQEVRPFDVHSLPFAFGGGSGEEEGEESESDEEDQHSQEEGRPFIAGEDEAEPMSEAQYRSIDQRLRESGEPFRKPYFPLALAVSRELPLRFNFRLRLLDSLSLPSPLVSRKDAILIPADQEPDEPVEFADTAEAIAYCQENLSSGWRLQEKGDQARGGRGRPSHPELEKESLFRQEGRSLRHLISSGQADLDSKLDDVRLDR